jgi:hypothetical protein
MKNFLVLIFIFSLLNVTAQKRHYKKKVKTTKHGIAKKDTIVASQSLTVSFISIGSGIDKVAFKTFKKSIETHDSLNACKLTYQVKNWGREGERDFYFPTQSTKKYNEFVKETEKTFGSSNRVRINKNVPPKQ